jgi:hypothetical protein
VLKFDIRQSGVVLLCLFRTLVFAQVTLKPFHTDQSKEQPTPQSKNGTKEKSPEPKKVPESNSAPRSSAVILKSFEKFLNDTKNGQVATPPRITALERNQLTNADAKKMRQLMDLKNVPLKKFFMDPEAPRPAEWESNNKVPKRKKSTSKKTDEDTGAYNDGDTHFMVFLRDYFYSMAVARRRVLLEYLNWKYQNGAIKDAEIQNIINKNVDRSDKSNNEMLKALEPYLGKDDVRLLSDDEIDTIDQMAEVDLGATLRTGEKVKNIAPRSSEKISHDTAQATNQIIDGRLAQFESKKKKDNPNSTGQITQKRSGNLNYLFAGPKTQEPLREFLPTFDRYFAKNSVEVSFIDPQSEEKQKKAFDWSTAKFCTETKDLAVGYNKTDHVWRNYSRSTKEFGKQVIPEDMSLVNQALNALKNPADRKLGLLALASCVLQKESGLYWIIKPGNAKAWHSEWDDYGAWQFNPNQPNGGNMVACIDDYNEILKAENKELILNTPAKRKEAATEASQKFNHFCGFQKLMANLACQQTDFVIKRKGQKPQNLDSFEKQRKCVSPFNKCANHFGSLAQTSKGTMTCMMNNFVKVNAETGDASFDLDYLRKIHSEQIKAVSSPRAPSGTALMPENQSRVIEDGLHQKSLFTDPKEELGERI